MSLTAPRVTSNTDEMSFHDLVSRKTQLNIPLFQRSYVWGRSQLGRMTKEILNIVEGEDENRFLGAVISVRRFANPAEPDSYEIVDGQQRLTTLYLFVVAGALVAARKGEIEYATDLINNNLIIPYRKNKPNTKLVPPYKDRAQFHAIFMELFKIKELASSLPEQARLPEAAGIPSGFLIAQFQRVTQFLEQQVQKAGEDGISRLQKYHRNCYNAVNLRANFVA